MTFLILDATTRAAVAAATSQQAVCDALVAPWAGGNVTARLFAPDGTTLLRTLTLGPFTISSSDPREVVCAAHLADTHVATGTPGLWVFRSGSTDIFSIDAGTSGASVNHAGAVKALCTPTLAGVVFTARAELPVLPTPAWAVGQDVGEWRAISGTAWPYGDGIINAWGILVQRGTQLISPANGGHEDSSDNGVYAIDVGDNAPTWSQLAAPSAVGDRLSGENYYADNKPTSRHGYHHAFWNLQRNRVMLVAGYGNYSTTSTESIDVVDGFNPDTGLWDAPGTWATLGYDRGQGQAMDPDTGDIWTNGGWRWTQSTNTWALVSGQTVSGGGLRQPVVWDSTREQWFCLQIGDNWGSGSEVNANIISRTTLQRTAITLTGTGASQFATDAGIYAGMCYVEATDKFYWYAGNVAGRVYVITPNGTTTWDISIASTTGASLPGGPSSGAGINGRVRDMEIAGRSYVVVMPTAASGLYALRVA